MDAAISVEGLTKRYGKLTAVSNLSLQVNAGEILGFLGLNGAGKTTTIRILLDLLRPSTGRVLIFGHDCQGDGLEARSEVGYLPGEMGLYPDLTGRELLDFLGGLNRKRINLEYRRELQERLKLPDSDLRRKLREYSTGMKRKLGLIQAFQAEPRLLILDEPTEGLDPLIQESFYELLLDCRQRGRTVFMSSHVLSEVERVCDRIALLRKGKLVLLRSVEEARGLAPRKVIVVFSADVRSPESFPAGVEAGRLEARTWTLGVQGELGPLVGMLAGLPVKDMQVGEARLEDVLVAYYREDSQ